MKAPRHALLIWRCGATGSCRRIVGWVEAVGPLEVIPAMDTPLGRTVRVINNPLRAVHQTRTGTAQRMMGQGATRSNDDAGHPPGDSFSVHCGKHWSMVDTANGFHPEPGKVRTVFTRPMDDIDRAAVNPSTTAPSGPDTV